MIPSSLERAQWLADHVLPHEAALRGWLSKRSTGTLEVEDIVQECYTTFAEMASVTHIHSPRNYLFQIATSIILQSVRRSKIVAFDALCDIDATAIAADTPLPDAYAAAREELSRVLEVIENLPPQARQVFVLRRIQGQSQRDVAREMQIAESTVEKHLARAVRSLMDSFGRGGKTTAQASQVRRPHEEDYDRKGHKL